MGVSNMFLPNVISYHPKDSKTMYPNTNNFYFSFYRVLTNRNPHHRALWIRCLVDVNLYRAFYPSPRRMRPIFPVYVYGLYLLAVPLVEGLMCSKMGSDRRMFCCEYFLIFLHCHLITPKFMEKLALGSSLLEICGYFVLSNSM